MAAPNNDPLFSKVGNISGATLTSAANTYDGTGANDTLVFTADATNGSFVDHLTIQAKGTNVATVLNVFLNNGSTNGTASNNFFIGELALPATTASATTPLATLVFPLRRMLPAGWKIYVGIRTAVSAGWAVTAHGGNY